MMDEKTYRLLVKQAYQKVEDAFEAIDPDVAEVEPGQGTLSILSSKGKIILSTQPSVRQLWLAVAAKGVAIHFNWDEAGKRWVDDKQGDKELYSFLETTLRDLQPGLESFSF
ncbi:iron donor protein CyaY [bacterium]|nr:iron donor protein CyaY [bacterium]